MEDEIITKLKLALVEPIKKECQVIYILVEIRKLLERLQNKNSFPVLNFYGNWVLHDKITRKSSMSTVHILLDEIESTIVGKKPNAGAVWALIDFEKFRGEIDDFLKKFNIQDPFVDENYWASFRGLFVNILTDCPLRPDYGNIEEFCFIKSLQEGDVDFTIKLKNRIPIRGSFTFLPSLR